MSLDFEPDKALERIEALGETVRLKIHLAGMDLKDEWRALEPDVEKAGHWVKDASTASAERLRDLLRRIEELAQQLP